MAAQRSLFALRRPSHMAEREWHELLTGTERFWVDAVRDLDAQVVAHPEDVVSLSREAGWVDALTNSGLDRDSVAAAMAWCAGAGAAGVPFSVVAAAIQADTGRQGRIAWPGISGGHHVEVSAEASSPTATGTVDWLTPDLPPTVTVEAVKGDTGEVTHFDVRTNGAGIAVRDLCVDHVLFGRRVHLDRVPADRAAEVSRSGAPLERLQASICAYVLGMAGHVLETVVEHVELRSQFGRKIATFQSVQHRLADLATAFAVCDIARLDLVEADADELGAASSSGLSAVYESIVLLGDSCRWAHQFTGGIGYTRELDLHQASNAAAHLSMLFDVESDLRAQFTSEWLGDNQMSQGEGYPWHVR